MPLNISPAVVTPSSNVLPLSLSTSFSLSSVFPILSNIYHDGTFERGLIQDGVNPPRPTRIWTLAKRLTTTQLTALFNFWETTAIGGLNPFYFYDPYQPAPGHAIGSNWDPTGISVQGRVTVFFRGNWSQQTQLGRHVVPNLTLVEVA